MASAPAAGTSRRSLALRGGLWSAAGSILPALGTAVLSVAAARYLGSGPLGRQSLIAYVNAAAAATLLVSLRTAMLQLGGRLQGQGDVARLRVLERWALPAHVAAGVVVAAILLLSAVASGQDSTAWSVIAVVSLVDAAAYGLSVRMILAEGWSAVGRMRLVSQLLGPVFGLVLLFLGFGIAGIFAGDGIAAIGLLVAMVVVTRRRRRAGVFADGEQHLTARRRVVVRPPVPVLRAYALFAVSAVITQIVSKRVEFVVLAVFASDVAIGMYSVAFMAVNLISMVPLGIATAALPIIAAADGAGESAAAARHLTLALRIGSCLIVPLVALLAVLGPPAVLLVYGSDYATAARLVPLASVSLLVTVVIGLCSQYWAGRGKLGIVLGTGAIAAVADIAVAVALVPPFGATGAVVANLVGQVALAAGLLVATVRRLGPVGWRVGGLVRAGIVAGGCIAAVLVVELAANVAFDNGSVRALVTLVVGGALAVPVGYRFATAFPLLDEAESAWLRPLVPGRARPILDRLTAA